MNQILQGDSLDVLKTIQDESVDLLCTDPPYGYSFMGKSWDKTLPDIGVFKECFRVLKPGAFAFVMSAPRSDVCARMMILLEGAGFNIGFTPIYWTYASGFPKAMNIGKMVDKRLGKKRNVVGTNSFGSSSYNQYQEDGRKQKAVGTRDITKGSSPLEGSYGGFQPKPAVEVVIVAMKPLSEKTFVDQALKNGKGITWLDDCRVPTTKAERDWQKATSHPNAITKQFAGGVTKPAGFEPSEAGRFPANLVVSDDVLNDGRVTKSNSGGFSTGAKFADGESGFTTNRLRQGVDDSGSYSRFFSLDSWAKTLPFLIVPKASKREKNEGLEDREKVTVSDGRPIAIDNAFQRGKTERVNSHPTVKPLTLMSYLITLGSRPNDVVLDPFLGSGTTAIAAKQIGRQYIGIEREQEYIDIANARLISMPNALL